MKEIFDHNPFEENPCQIFEAKIFWLPIMYILMCRNIFFPKWGLIGFWLRVMHPDAWYSAAYSYNSYFEDFYQPNWPIHKSRIIKISKTYKPLFWRFLDSFWVVLDGFWAVFGGFCGYIVLYIISNILRIFTCQTGQFTNHELLKFEKPPNHYSDGFLTFFGRFLGRFWRFW